MAGRTVQLALTFGPLAAYLLRLGLWQAGRRSRVVLGTVDFAWLACGLGGLVAFGPIGEAAVRLLFPRPSPWSWMAWVALLSLLAMLGMPRAARRLVVYNVRPEVLTRALARALAGLPGDYHPTLHGFEDSRGTRGVLVDRSSSGRIATLNADADKPEAFLAGLAPRLRDELRDEPIEPAPFARAYFVMAFLLLLIPLSAGLKLVPVAASLRAFWSRMAG